MPYTEINSERQFKDVTGHGKSDFFKLLKDFEKHIFGRIWANI